MEAWEEGVLLNSGILTTELPFPNDSLSSVRVWGPSQDLLRARHGPTVQQAPSVFCVSETKTRVNDSLDCEGPRDISLRLHDTVDVGMCRVALVAAPGRGGGE